MGLFDLLGAREAHGRMYGGDVRHDVTHELLAGAAGFEAMRVYEHHRELGRELIAGFAAAEVDKHFDSRGLGHLDRGEARRLAREQAQGLYDQQYSQYYPQGHRF
jgi:hypothetical protein